MQNYILKNYKLIIFIVLYEIMLSETFKWHIFPSFHYIFHSLWKKSINYVRRKIINLGDILTLILL